MAFYDNNLYPDTVFATARSVEIITGADHRRLGTLFGPDPRRLRADDAGRGA